MSKLVVKIRDDDRNFVHCPLHHEGYCHLPQTHYYQGNALYMQQCLGTLNKRPNWCPLKEEKEEIPVEWIKGWIDNISSNPRYKVIGEIRNISPTKDVAIAVPCVSDMLDDWEKENE